MCWLHLQVTYTTGITHLVLCRHILNVYMCYSVRWLWIHTTYIHVGTHMHIYTESPLFYLLLPCTGCGHVIVISAVVTILLLQDIVLGISI